MKTLVLTAILVIAAQCYVIEDMEVYMENNKSGDYASEAATDFCHGHQCPQYKVLNSTGDFEIRLYNKSTWVHCKAEGNELRSTASHPYYALRYYMNGHNRARKNFNMTLPILDTFEEMYHYPITTNVHFFLPESYNPIPKPLGRDVKIVSIPERKFYVRTFASYDNAFTFHNVRLEEDHLIDSLKEAGLKYDGRHTYFAAYGSPAVGEIKHNELWLAAQA